jgi:hypothetical protein
MRTRVMVSILVAAMCPLTACAHAQPASRPVSAARTEAGTAAAPAPRRDAAIYVAVLRRYLSAPGENSFPEGTFKKVFVLSDLHPQAGSPMDDQKHVVGLPAETQREVADGVADVASLTFVADRASVIDTSKGCAHVRDDGILITLAPVDDSRGTQVQVGINGFVACLGATWLTYVVSPDPAGGWRVTGTTGVGAIA